VLASTRKTGKRFEDLKVMFLGAGSAATGIGDLMAQALVSRGLSQQSAIERLWFVDLDGLVVKGRTDLAPHNLPYAHDHPMTGFLQALDAIKPDVLIGASGAPGTFNETVIRKMSEMNDRPVIFALSNPTSRAECSAEEAYKWSDGRAIYSSGSPFKPVVLADGSIRKPGQGNNAYVFPGIGLGVLAAQARIIPESFFLTAAEALASFVSNEDLAVGALYPKLCDIRNVSHAIAVAVAEEAFAAGLSPLQRPDDLSERVRAMMYAPTYD